MGSSICDNHLTFFPFISTRIFPRPRGNLLPFFPSRFAKRLGFSQSWVKLYHYHTVGTARVQCHYSMQMHQQPDLLATLPVEVRPSPKNNAPERAALTHTPLRPIHSFISPTIFFSFYTKSSFTLRPRPFPSRADACATSSDRLLPPCTPTTSRGVTSPYPASLAGQT